MRRILLSILTGVIAGQLTANAQSKNQAELVSVKRIWDEAPHNAFTDLVHFHDEWLCVFREGKAHVSPDGALRVIASKDGERWTSVAVLKSAKGDLRDAKIAITPDGKLMLNGALALAQPATARHQSIAWFSTDGRNWDEGHEIGDPDFWLWRVTWQGNNAYAVGYNTDKDRKKRFLRLYRSEDGKRFETLVPKLFAEHSPGENTLRFLQDGTCLCLVRRDLAPHSALLGTAKAPYQDWRWQDLGLRIGGPNFIQLPDGRFVAACRLHDGETRTSLLWLEPMSGKLTEFLKLPSGGDCSYAGLVWHDNLLWVSYYSTHEQKTSIYLAKVRLSGKP